MYRKKATSGRTSFEPIRFVVFTLHEGDSQALAAKQYGRTLLKVPAVNEWAQIPAKCCIFTAEYDRGLRIALKNLFGNRCKQMAPTGEIVPNEKPDYMCSSKTSTQLLPFRVPGMDQSGRTGRWNVENVPKGRMVFQEKRSVVLNLMLISNSTEKFLVRLHCTALKLNRF